MCVCVFALDFYIMLRGTPCAPPVSKMAAYIFSKPFPFLQKKTVPQFITLLAPKMGKKERSTTQIFFFWLERKRKEICAKVGLKIAGYTRYGGGRDK